MMKKLVKLFITLTLIFAIVPTESWNVFATNSSAEPVITQDEQKEVTETQLPEEVVIPSATPEVEATPIIPEVEKTEEVKEVSTTLSTIHTYMENDNLVNKEVIIEDLVVGQEIKARDYSLTMDNYTMTSLSAETLVLTEIDNVIYYNYDYQANINRPEISITSTTMSSKARMSSWVNNDQPGAVFVTKEARWADEGNGIAAIDFTVKGNPVITGSDVLLIVDNSQSMVQGIDRWTPLKDAVQAFVSQLYADVDGKPSTNKIGMISFSDNGYQESGGKFLGTTDLINVGTQGKFTATQFYQQKVWEFLNPNGNATNYEDAFRYATSMFNGIDKSRPRFIIFLSDGVPNKGNYDTAKSYADTLKADGVKIYSLGLQLDASQTEGSTTFVPFEKYIQPLASEPVSQYAKDIKDLTQLEPIYQELAGEMKIAGTQAVLVDVINDDVFEVANKPGTSTNATYTANTADLSKVTMVRVTATKPIPSQSIATFNVHLQIDETLQSAQVDNKIGKMNEYNPYYYVKSSTFQGSLKGTPIGTQLVIGEIKGLTFLDLDANGTFDGLDVALPSQRISLWKYNDTNSNYEEVLDESGNQLIIQSDTNGIYEFSDTQGVTTGVYAIKFELENGYRFTPSLGGSNENLSQVGYVGLNEGWIKGIDPTIPSSQSLNSGYVKYNINDITLVHPSTSAIKLNKIYNETAQFSYLSMSRLLSKTDAYEWELVNPADSNYLTLLSNKTNTMTLIGEKITQTPVYIKLTIHDIYGDTRTFDPIEISVLGNSAPILELNNNEINVSVGASLDTSAAAMLKPIIDDYDTLSYSDVRVTSNLNLNKVGYYKVTYAVTDSDGNTSSVDLIVKVHGLPYLVDKNGLPVDLSNLPLKKRSNEEALYFLGLHPVYEKVINETTTNPFESIPLGNVANQGVAVVTGIKDKFDNIFAPSQDILKVGVYEISYYLENPYGGISELKRELRVRGNISVRDGSLDYSSTSAVKNYSSLKEFLDANTINGLYAAVEILGLNDITEIKDLVPDDITYVGSIPFDEIDFTELPQGQTSNTIMIPCEVTDSQSGYSTKTKAINIFVHIFDNSANAPVITIDYPITYRLTTDPILMLDGNTEVLPSGGSDFKASDIYKKLMEYVKVEQNVTIELNKNDIQVDAKDYNPKQEGEYTIGFSYEFTPLNKMITASAVVYVVNQNPPTPTPGPTSVPSPLPPNNEVVTPPINQETTNGSLVVGNGKPIQPTTTPEIIEDVVVGGFEIKLYRKQNFPKKVKDENYWWVIIVVIIAGIIIYILIKKDDKK